MLCPHSACPLPALLHALLQLCTPSTACPMPAPCRTFPQLCNQAYKQGARSGTLMKSTPTCSSPSLKSAIHSRAITSSCIPKQAPHAAQAVTLQKFCTRRRSMAPGQSMHQEQLHKVA
jgi:hypothetical protein